MPELGKTPIQHYRTSTASAVPLAGNLADGEIAINQTDKKIFAKNNVGTVVELAGTTNLAAVAGTTAGPTITSDTGTNVVIPSAGASASGIVTTDTQSFGGIKTFTTALDVTGTTKAAGYFYAGTTNPSNTTRRNLDGDLYVNNLLAIANVTAYASDKRLKTNVLSIPNALNKVCQLEGITYTWNEEANTLTGYDTVESQVGVFAQDVQAILPEAVKIAPFDVDESGGSKSGENYLTVQYDKLVPLLIEAIKELRAEVELLKGGA